MLRNRLTKFSRHRHGTSSITSSTPKALQPTATISALSTTTLSLRTMRTPANPEHYEKLLLETYEDPLKKDFDSRMHKHYGSDTATKLTTSDQSRLMPNDNVCVVLTKLEQLEYFELEKPSIIEPWEVLLEILNVGVCGSDFEYYKHGQIGPLVMRQPFIMGHETGARVIAMGHEASTEGRLNIGDIVALEPQLVCGECDACKANIYNLCPRVAFFATPPVHGTMRRYMKHHFKYCFTVGNDNNSVKNVANSVENVANSDKNGKNAGNGANSQELSEIAALCEPLSVGIHAGGPNVAKIKEGDFVGIFGAGPIGIINMLTSIYYGASKVFITDIEDGKLGIVDNYIANNREIFEAGNVQIETINTRKNPLNREYLSSRFGVREGKCDHTIECVGNERVLNDCIDNTKSGGMITVIGMAADPSMKIDISSFNIYEKTINGVFRYRYTYPEAIKMLLSGKVGNVRDLITARPKAYERSELEDGFQTISKNMKIMFQM